MKACRKGVPDMSRGRAMRWLSVTEHLKRRTPSCTYIHITVAYEYLMIKVFKEGLIATCSYSLEILGNEITAVSEGSRRDC